MDIHTYKGDGPQATRIVAIQFRTLNRIIQYHVGKFIGPQHGIDSVAHNICQDVDVVRFTGQIPKDASSGAFTEVNKRIDELESALALALTRLVQFEPSDSRAVSNEFVAMASVSCGLANESDHDIIRFKLQAAKVIKGK